MPFIIGAIVIIAFVVIISNIAALGQIQVNGVEWSARSSDNSHIPAGTLVKVDKIEGVKVFVTEVKAPIPAAPAEPVC